MLAPSLTARLQAALEEVVRDASARPDAERSLRELGREAEASGARLTDVVESFLQASLQAPLQALGAAGQVGEMIPLLTALLAPYDAARSSQRQTAGRLMNIQEEDRRRLAAQIHDDAIQVMAAAYMRLQMLSRKLADPAEREACEALERTVKLAVKSLQRLVVELRPTAMEITGLAGALGDYLQQVGLDTGLEYRLLDGLSTQPGDQHRLILYRAAQEALANIAKHAAASTITVALSEDDGGFSVTVDDDGRGFPNGHTGRGLAAVRERAEAVGGTCRVDSVPGRGTSVRVWVPRHDPLASQDGG